MADNGIANYSSIIMPANFSGKWKSVKSEGWDKLLGQFGVPVDKFPPDIVVTEEITQSGNKITVKATNNKNADVKEIVINVGSNFTDTVVPGVSLEFATAWEGNKLVMKRTNGEGSATRELVGGNMVVTLTDKDGNVAKSTLQKI